MKYQKTLAAILISTLITLPQLSYAESNNENSSGEHGHSGNEINQGHSGEGNSGNGVGNIPSGNQGNDGGGNNNGGGNTNTTTNNDKWKVKLFPSEGVTARKTKKNGGPMRDRIQNFSSPRSLQFTSISSKE